MGEATPTDDMPLARNTSPKFDIGRNFSNKVWNATRFALGRLEGKDNTGLVVNLGEARFADRWIIARLYETIASLEKSFATYHFNEVANTLYDFVWRDVCDRYLEAVKSTIDDDPNQQVVLGAVLDAVLRILHPVCPFVSETLWPHVSDVRTGEVAAITLPASELLTLAAWPAVDGETADATIISEFERADALVAAIRVVRSEQQVKPRRMITMHLPLALSPLLAIADGYVESLAGIALVEIGDAPTGASPLVFEGKQIGLSDMVDAADVGAEIGRLTKKATELKGQVGGLEGRLSNKGYVDNAPAKLVDETRAQLAALKADLEATEAALAALR
jgi:valyl-tRNA synthetase